MKYLSVSHGVRSTLAGIITGLSLGLAATSIGHAAESASGQISSASLGGGEFKYTITLTDTGTTNLDTFWYAWIPGQDYMPASPTDIISPTGWSDIITHGGGADGFAIQWQGGSSPLTPGSSLNFSYESTDTPAVTAGNSPLFPTTPLNTSFVYTGAPFSDAGVRFDLTTAAVPEPSTWATMGLGLAFLAFLGRRQVSLRK